MTLSVLMLQSPRRGRGAPAHDRRVLLLVTGLSLVGTYVWDAY
ncbi:MAG: hypothetical protein R2742_10935 [Micropruina glycogenica]